MKTKKTNKKIKSKIRYFLRFNAFVFLSSLVSFLYCSLLVDKLILRGSIGDLQSALFLQISASRLYILGLLIVIIINAIYYFKLLGSITKNVLLGNFKKMTILCCLDVLKSVSFVYYVVILINAHNYINWWGNIILVLCILLSSIIFPIYKNRFLMIICIVSSLIPIVIFPFFLPFGISRFIEKCTQAWNFQHYYHWYIGIEVLIMLLLPITIVCEKLLGDIKFDLEKINDK